jgi:hypothetical protein
MYDDCSVCMYDNMLMIDIYFELIIILMIYIYVCVMYILCIHECANDIHGDDNNDFMKMTTTLTHTSM